MPTFQQEFSLSRGYKNGLLTHKNCQLSLVCQEVGPPCLQRPHCLCSLFIRNSLPSEMLCVWKFFSNLPSDCHDRISSVQFNSVTQSYSTLCDPMDCSMTGFPVHHQLPELTQTLVHQVGDAIQPSHPLSSPSPAFHLFQH